MPPLSALYPACLAACRYGRETPYQQPFMPDAARLCINCAKPVPGVPKAAQPAEALLDGMTHLFCRCVRLDGLVGSE
jgi:hypothetical protein